MQCAMLPVAVCMILIRCGYAHSSFPALGLGTALRGEDPWSPQRAYLQPQVPEHELALCILHIIMVRLERLADLHSTTAAKHQ
jgi:hypothetical protein